MSEYISRGRKARRCYGFDEIALVPGDVSLDPNDVDVVLVMDEAFHLEDCPIEVRGLFDHAVAQARYGASIFWVRPGLLIGESLEDFITSWQIKRDGSRRGIVEVIP